VNREEEEMNSLSLFHPVERQTVMETIMKPLITIRRKGRWLMAAGLALASLAPSAAGALTLAEPELKLDRLERVEPEPGRVTPFFEKVGRQRGCDHVEYRLRFGVKGSPEALSHPAFADTIRNFRMDLSDQMPNGLTVISVHASGDGTDVGGGALPSGSIDTTADPNDTAKLDDFRLSATDLDGSGEADRRYVDVRIVAKIDPAAFPAPTLIDNQGWVRVTRPAGAAVDIPSHDPAEPDDGDFLTGAKTTILVDLTGCDRPPPPPTGEPCFEVVTGKVDCVPGGGAFIYHMPVGPELGGKWVQLRTTTPGVTVAPAMQLVPAGGGVLNWTITGALPGDTVHLIVTGIETYAGPEEGVGLCCTQTVDIEIPPDLDCPDKEREPDLKVQKRADVARCTKEGGCDFTIRVTNVGDAPYNGKIVLDEVTAPGSAAVESGPNAPWTCVPMASPMSCEHPATTLNPGEWVELKLGFEPGPAWDWGAIRNCAEYDYTASGKELFGLQTNDKACASIPICVPGRDRECTPPVEKKVDLTIRKQALSPVCSLDGVCLWRIDIINSGTETIDGPLTVSDTYPAGVPASSMFEPTPPWVCGPDGPGAFTCQHPGMVLVPGASTPIFVRTIVGDGFDRDQIENCAEVKPVPGETNLTNNKSCAKARVPNRNPGKPAMRITKTCAPAVAGAAISCRITVISVGTAAPSGPVSVNDAAELIGAGTPVQIQTVAPDGAEWSCGPVPADTLSCKIPGSVMTPGTSRHFDVTLSVSANQRFENCARGSYGPAPGDDIVYPIGEACAQGGSTIKVEKTGDQQCVVGQPCTFEITIRNEGDAPFNGTVQIGDAMEVEGFGRLEGVAISEISPPFGCNPEPATLPISCDANLSLGAGEARVHQVTVVIPDDGRFDNLTDEVAGRNCVAVLAPGTPVRGNGMEPISRGESGKADLGDAVACHSFVMSKHQEQKQCSEGFVMDANGRCGCPEGTTFRNGKCSGGSTTPPPPVKDPETPRQCKLLQGQIRTDDGRCVCPNGTELKNGACRRIVTEEPPVRQCKLLPGQIRTNSGRCICPRGTELKNGACRRIVTEQPPTRQCTLLPGQVRTKDGKCVCPRGTRLVGKACRTIEKPVECKKGQRLINGRCVTILPPRKCPAGTVGTPPNCRQVQLREPPKRIINPDALRKVLPLREPSKRPATNNVQ